MDWQKEAERLRDLLGRYAVVVQANEGVDFSDRADFFSGTEGLLSPEEADEIRALKTSRPAFARLYGEQNVT